MNYKISITEIKSEQGLKGFATVTFNDCFKITNIAVRANSNSGELFVAMPRYKTAGNEENPQGVYQDVCNPITAEFRKQLYEDIINAYKSEGKKLERGDDTPLKDEMPPFTVKVVPYSQEGSNVIGFARIYLEESFVVNNVTILQGKENVFVSMPSYKTKEVDENSKPVYRDICYPVTKEFREKLYGTILETYQQEKEKRLEAVSGKSKARREEVQKEEKKEEPEQKPAKPRKTAKK